MDIEQGSKNSTFLLLLVIIGLGSIGCTSIAVEVLTPTAGQPILPATGTRTAAPEEGEASGAETTVPATRVFDPYPYTTPLPPPTPTVLDGTYARTVDHKADYVPCRRCAPYKAEGGQWVLSLQAGVFRVSHEMTGFQGVGSFTVTGDQLAIFNDPNCYREVGRYRWRLDNGSLSLEIIEDACAFGLRAKSLTGDVWLNLNQNYTDPCQPPSVEAAVTGHWPIPAGCEEHPESQKGN